jgi:hypothetical protein
MPESAEGAMTPLLVFAKLLVQFPVVCWVDLRFGWTACNACGLCIYLFLFYDLLFQWAQKGTMFESSRMFSACLTCNLATSSVSQCLVCALYDVAVWWPQNS